MPTTPAASHRSFDLAAWLPSRKALLWVLGAFALGLLLFFLVWRGSDDGDFYRAGPAPTAAAPGYAPLPAPVAGERGEEVSDVAKAPRPAPDNDERPRLVETQPPAPPPVAAAAPAARPIAPGAFSQPQPISSPAPRYPARALRRGDQGTVLVSARISPDGVPLAVDVARSSGSRLLDRAAVDAVRRWRFRPAMADGRPVAGRVQVPITFEN